MTLALTQRRFDLPDVVLRKVLPSRPPKNLLEVVRGGCKGVVEECVSGNVCDRIRLIAGFASNANRASTVVPASDALVFVHLVESPRTDSIHDTPDRPARVRNEVRHARPVASPLVKRNTVPVESGALRLSDAPGTFLFLVSRQVATIGEVPLIAHF